MSASAWILFAIGAVIIWGGLIVSLTVAYRHSKKQQGSTES